MKLRCYRARFAASLEDLHLCQRLRHRAFFEARGLGVPGGIDADEFDRDCRHMMVEEVISGRLVCCFRMLSLESGAGIGRSYSARWYGLDRLRRHPGPLIEVGRFCVDPERKDPAITRIAWSRLARHVEQEGVGLLFGCSSFQGVDAEAYAFALLKERHLAPPCWRPRAKAPNVFPFARTLRLRRPDMALAMKRMPPLLRSYLRMGGWVSDHAVIDADLDTLHVFTGIEIARVPEARARMMLRG